MPSRPEPEQIEILQTEARRLRAAGVLGKGGRLQDLFDYLLAQTLNGVSPKEQEIAYAVFAKPATGPAEDATVRVYVHRLRKRLNDHYMRQGAASGPVLTIPRGAYRLALERDADQQDRSDGVMAAARRRPASGAWILAAGMAVIALVCAAGWIAAASWPGRGDSNPFASAIWAPLEDSQRPLVLVIGDYYMFGEYEDDLFLTRLIRDFDINSKEDLTREMRERPALFSKYGDVSLEYLPTSAAYAMTDLSAVIAEKRPWTVLASDLMPETIKCCDIIYLGLTSGLGPLEETMLSRSGYTFGETYDEIRDTRSDETHVSEAFLAAPGETMYRDYGLFSMFEGPTGNTIWVFAGARDTGLMGLTESLSDAGWVKRFLDGQAGTPGYEALFEITGQKHVNLETRLVSEGVSETQAAWNGMLTGGRD